MVAASVDRKEAWEARGRVSTVSPTQASMGVTTLYLLLASWFLQGVVGAEFASQPLPVTHRPGAILVKGPEVSAAVGAYRLFIGLPIYDYAPELTALSIHENASDSSLIALNKLHDRLSSPSSSSGSKLKQRLIALFHDLSKRISVKPSLTSSFNKPT